MRKIISLASAVVLMLGMSSVSVSAAEISNQQDIQVEILSPTEIQSNPIYEGDVQIQVTNNGTTDRDDLSVFLTVVDEDRNQSFPMDEFGLDSFQTRRISLKKGESTVVPIPIRIMYVGNFDFVANVADYSTGEVFAAQALPAQMISNTNMNKNLMRAVAIATPIILFIIAKVLTGKRGRIKED